MNNKRTPIIITLVMILLLACQALQAPLMPSATATSTVTNTNTSAPTSTNTATEEPTATATDIPTNTPMPDPGLDEVRKINADIMDGGPVEFFGRGFDENSHDAKGSTKYTEGYSCMVIVKNNGRFTVWFGETYLSYTMPEESRYITYCYNSTVDVDESEAANEMLYAVNTIADEMLSIMPRGITFLFSIQGMDGSVDPANDIAVTIDHDHNVEALESFRFPARQFTELAAGKTITFPGGAIRSFTCSDSDTKTVVVVWKTYTAQCPEQDAEMMNVHFVTPDGTNNPPAREGTDKENARLLKYLLSRMDEFAHGSVAEYYWFGETILGDALPFDSFADTHQVAPPATNTPLATFTRTPRPTVTPTINMTIAGTVTPSMNEVTCSNTDQDVTYTVTGPMIGTPFCAKGMTLQEVPVDTLVIPGPQGVLLITLDRVGGNGMYAVVIDNPGSYGTPSFTLTGTSIASGHPEKSAENDVLEAVMNSSVVTMHYTVGDFTVDALAWLK